VTGFQQQNSQGGFGHPFLLDSSRRVELEMLRRASYNAAGRKPDERIENYLPALRPAYPA
jgi:hypothetical protein